MNKDLPKMFRCSINKEINNVQNVYSTINNSLNEIDSNVIYNNFDIENKINNIFNSSNFVYKADVNILTSKGLFRKRIVARRNGYLITIDNEMIPINDIKDLY